MDINEHIPTEIIQIFSSAEVSNYHVIPYEKEGTNELKCYGKYGVNYKSILEEIEVIYGLSVSLTIVSVEEFDRGMNLYYRQGKTSKSNINISQIGNSDFINSLIEEADSIRSSDIHIEPYEKQCRVRMRIDGKLIERYIIP